jgi:hypothetical protein
MPEPLQSRSEAADRVIRVLISSTFRDMMQERDLLVKEVFPELRRKCAKRFVTFTEVDLRWGITEEQANEGQVLPLCLAEIERSRPYFLGLLGQRYGWTPDTISPEVIEREPWLKEHIHGHTSVTELEILHGVLNNPKMADHAFFYFRDPSYGADPSLSNDQRRDMVECDIRADVERYGQAEATRRTEERKAKLAALKQRIRDSNLPLVESYTDPKALAEIVRRQFDELIDRLYPENQVPDPLAQERLAHEAHAKNKLFTCIDRPTHLAALDAFAGPVEHNGKGLVVTGESGGGKTALLAAWARDWAQKHPDNFVFQHYFGATPEGFLRRLLGELKGRFGIADDIPADPEKLRDAVPVWLAQTIGKGRIVLVLDGLNQVQGGEADRHVGFLPRHFPPHVTVLASALPGAALDAPARTGLGGARTAAGRRGGDGRHGRPVPEHPRPHAGACASASIDLCSRRGQPALLAYGAGGAAAVRQFRASAPAGLLLPRSPRSEGIFSARAGPLAGRFRRQGSGSRWAESSPRPRRLEPSLGRAPGAFRGRMARSAGRQRRTAPPRGPVTHSPCVSLLSRKRSLKVPIPAS